LDEIELIEVMLKQTFEGVAWHGPAFMQVLKGVDRAEASEQQIKSRHTIWEIVNHCSYWMEAVTKAVHSKEMPGIEDNEDWPKAGTTVAEWNMSLHRLKRSFEELVVSAKSLTASLLTQKVHGSFKGRTYTTTFRKMFHGVSDHNTYHAGQIAILRKKNS
jgi:hypothetical protein